MPERGARALPGAHEGPGARRGRRARRRGRPRSRGAPAPGRARRRALGRPRRRGAGCAPTAPTASRSASRAVTYELLNRLALDTKVGVLSTNVSRRVISPDCDTHGDRTTVVVRGSEQLAGLRLEVREGTRVVRVVRLRKRARALAISWPPYAGKHCTTAADGRYRLRVIARDVAGNTRALVRRRGDGARRRVLAARPLDHGGQASARGHLGGCPGPAPRSRAPRRGGAGGARTQDARARRGRPPAGRPARRRLRRQHAPRRADVPRPAGSARRAAGARRARGRHATGRGLRCRSSGAWTRSASASTSSRSATSRRTPSCGYTAIVAPPFDPSRGLIVTGGVKLVRTLAGITRGLGS